MGSDDIFKKKKLRSEASFKRGRAIKTAYAIIYIICEGHTERNYIGEIIKKLGITTAKVIVITNKGSAPISITEHAFNRARTTENIDWIICVFDRDNHESYARALDMINTPTPKRNDKSKPKYMCITSEPCFEIWLLLHFQYSTRAYNHKPDISAAEQIISDLLKVLPTYSKSHVGWLDEIYPKTEKAIKNAEQLEDHNMKTNTKNPHTKMHELVRFLKKIRGSKNVPN